ncbi:MAG: DNA repair protein RecN, partial [Lysobacteraceae bacterium]
LARRWQQADRAVAELQARGDVNDRVDFLRHPLAELEAETLDEASLAGLQALHRRATQAEALVQASERAMLLLGDEDGAMAPIGQALAALAKWTADEPRLAEAAGLAESARLQLAEAVALVEQARDGFDLDPEDLAEAERRLSRLHDLARKHRVPLADLSARRDALAAELAALDGAEARLAALVAEREAAARAWREAAEALSAARSTDAEALGTAVAGLMAGLGMGGGRFEVQLEPVDDPRPQVQGLERVEFLVSANPGQPPRALRKVASGGELARIALAIEVATLGLDDTPTMVFDEVDTGIGGAVAEVVGQTLRRLGSGRQVLCVTHLPQVAAQGHAHWRVTKATDGRDTWSEPAELDEAGRVDEIARMLGGVEITAAVRTSARQMLEKARKG